MNITNVRAFVTVVDAGSFSRAACKLSVSQPAVTTQVRTLEEELGETLLDRQYRNIELTEAGELFLPYARMILQQIQLAQDVLQEQVGAIGGHLNIAASTLPGSYLVPRLMGAFAHLYPHVALDLTISDSTHATEAVHAGNAHLALVGARIRDLHVDFEEIATDRLTVIAAPTHRLAGQDQVTFDDLKDERWIMHLDQGGAHQAVRQALRDGGHKNYHFNSILTLGFDEAIISAVEGDLGVAILSRIVAQKALETGSVVELDMSHYALERPLYLVTPHRKPTRAARAFRTFLREQISS